MTLIPHKLTREFITSHPEWTFVYSHNFWQNVWVGPSAICKGLHNCYGVPVRWKLCKSSGYFQDTQLFDIKQKIDEMVGKIPRDRPIILFPKIGNGDSRMHIFAPKAYAYLHEQLDAIKWKDYQYDYR